VAPFDPLANRLLAGSALGLLGGLLLVVSGKAIIDATQSGTYSTVLGLEVITSLVAVIGAVVCVISLLCMIFGVWRLLRSSKQE
jgi:hypothetical protein